MALLGSLCLLIGLVTASTANVYVYVSPSDTPECKGLQHPLDMQRRRTVAPTILRQAPFHYGFRKVTYECYLEEEAFKYLEGENDENRVCPSDFACLFYQGQKVEGESFPTFFSKVLTEWQSDLYEMKPADQAGCNYKEHDDEKRFACVIRPYAILSEAPECTDLQHPLPMKIRRTVAPTILRQAPFHYGFRNVTYDCTLEEMAFKYLKGEDGDKHDCPSGFVCLFYQSGSHNRQKVAGQSFPQFFSKILAEWQSKFYVMKPADQAGCNYKEGSRKGDRFACVIRPLAQ